MTDISDKAVQDRPFDLRLAFDGMTNIRALLPDYAQPMFDVSLATLRARIEADAKIIEAAEQAVAVVEDKVTTFDAGYKATFGERGLPTDWQNTSMTLPLAPFDDLRSAIAAREQVKR